MSGAVLLNPDDPFFNFEHMMQHRQYFPVLPDLSAFSILPYLLDPAVNQDMPAWWWNKTHQQAHDDFNHNLPSNYSNGYNLHTVTPLDATGSGTLTGTSLVVTGVTNTILLGSTVAGVGVPAGTTVVSQQSGSPGGPGTYTVSQSATLPATPMTFSHPAYHQAIALTPGTFGIPQGQILIEGTGQTAENRAWWTFANHQEHFIANDAILPLPTTAPTTAGTPPGQAAVSNPWWWVDRSPIKFPFW